MSPDAKFALIWVTFTLLVWGALIPMLVWAVKTRQFTDQNRARHLALRSGPPATEERPHGPGMTGITHLGNDRKDAKDVSGEKNDVSP